MLIIFNKIIPNQQLFFPTNGLSLHYKNTDIMNKKQVQQRFLKFYNTLTDEDKRDFRNRVFETCKIEPPSFYSWLSRTSIPKWHIDNIDGLITEFESNTALSDKEAVL